MEKYIVREYENGKMIDEIIFQNYPIAKIVYDYLIQNNKSAELVEVR
jgi:hypothetical protein